MKNPWPLMENNITLEDLNKVIEFLKTEPVLTQASQVSAFEEEWSEWLKVKYSVFVNSGSSANIISLAILSQLEKNKKEIILAPFGWVSDIVAVLLNGFKPVFVDINPKTLSADNDQIIEKISENTAGVLLVHAQGFNGLSDKLLKELNKKNIPLIEDVCESHGAVFNNKKLGSFGLISNFSFYFAHHMSTVEGGMICTNDKTIYEMARLFRSHGMVREAKDQELKKHYQIEYPDLNPDFIFAYPGFNMRNTEIGAVIGRNQLKRLDQNNKKRIRNLEIFLKNLDPERYWTDFYTEGSCNYAFNIICKKSDPEFCNKVMNILKKNQIEFRRGSAGGGNQLRQPYIRSLFPEGYYKKFPVVEHIHFYGMYVGNYPTLNEKDILDLCNLLNEI